MTGVGLNQAKNYAQIIGKIKLACADSFLQLGISPYCKAQLGFDSKDVEVVFAQENQVSVAEHWVSERYLPKTLQFRL